MTEITLEKINEAIKNANAKWKTRDHPLLRASPTEKKRALGLRINESQLKSLRAKAAIDIKTVIEDFGRQVKRLNEVDWRNNENKNYVTSIKNQKNCGSCVGFGVTATLESMVLLEHGKECDLSESELFFCGGKDDASCSNGWWPSRAIPYLVDKGLSPEECFPYDDNDIACITCQERDNQAIRISKHVEIMNAEDRKVYLSSVGPLIGGMRVFSDFMSYGEGIYSHVTGEEEGGHCIQIVGFSDTEKCCICKNSWGPNWGENGFFRIEYNQCGLDTEFPMWGIAKTQIQ